MPILRTRKAMEALPVGQLLEVWATDRGAPADFKAWCQQTDQKFLGVLEADGYLRLFLKKVVVDTKEKGKLFDCEMSNEELARRLATGERLTILDVREPEEYASGHIPGAHHVPVEEIESYLAKLARDLPVAVVCRSGRRSGYVCQILRREGFTQVYNVVPGMTGWTGALETPAAVGDRP